MERLATEQEMDSILVDVWSFRTNFDGLIERVNQETMTLRQAVARNPGYRPLVSDRLRRAVTAATMQRTGDEPV